MENKIETEFIKWKAQFDDDLPPPNRNYYGNWFYGLCEPNIAVNKELLSAFKLRINFMENTFKVFETRYKDSDSFIKEYGGLLNRCENSIGKYGYLYVYRRNP